jgi:hypothetical protein
VRILHHRAKKRDLQRAYMWGLVELPREVGAEEVGAEEVGGVEVYNKAVR